MMLWLSVALAQEFGGFAEVRAQGYVGVDSDVPILLVERLRPTFTAPLGERVKLTATIEAGLSQGWRVNDAFTTLIEDQGLSPDLATAIGGGRAYENKAFSISDASDYLAVDRLAVEVYLPFMDVRLGRQALNWGSGFVVNPSDPFPEVLLTEPWKPRSGVNALRVDVPFGELNTVQLVVAANDAFTHPRFAGRVTINTLDTDFSLVGAYREEADSGIVGLDVKGTLGIGFWFEGVVHVQEERSPYEEFNVGLDYSFPVLEQLIVTGQYYRNGGGSTGVGPSLLAEREPFAPVFGGRDYLMASVSAGLTQDVSVSALWIQNLNDGTAFVVPNAGVFATTWLQISLAAQIPIAFGSAGGEFRPSSEQLVQQLPAADGSLTTVDLGGLVPEATIILWTRATF